MSPLKTDRRWRRSEHARRLRSSESCCLPNRYSSPDCNFTLMTTTLAHQLANYACSLNFEDLSKNVVHEVKRRVIDSLGCALGAWNQEPCAIARKVASQFSAEEGSTI